MGNGTINFFAKRSLTCILMTAKKVIQINEMNKVGIFISGIFFAKSLTDFIKKKTIKFNVFLTYFKK
jgi:hypothetical protein